MSDVLDWLAELGSNIWYYKVAYVVAFIVWLVAFLTSWSIYGRAFWRVRGKDSLPFVVRSLFLVTTGVVETGFYAAVVWFAADDRNLRLLAVMFLPVGVTIQAAAVFYFLYRASRPE